MQEEKLEHICSSIEEAEKKIYEMILHQTPQNRIAETTFVIKDIKRRFNPATISKIKKKFEQNNTIVRKDPVTAKLFREFREGFGVVDVQIKTKDELKIIEDTYEKYCKHEGIVLLSKKQFEDLRDLTFDFLDRMTTDTTKKEDVAIDKIIQTWKDIMGDPKDWET